MLNKRLIITLSVALLAATLHGQKAQVLSLNEDITCLTAAENEVLDANGEACALLKIRILDHNVSFKSDWLIRSEAKEGNEHWVWLCNGTRDITVTSDLFLPHTVVFAEHNARIKGLKGRHTYELVLSTPQAAKPSGIEVTLVCNVPQATLTVDGFPIPSATTRLAGGKHQLKAVADGYEPYEGEININPYQSNQRFEIAMRTAITSAADQVKEGLRHLQTSNYSEAAKWFSRASFQKDAEGLYQMGLLYYRGWGVVQDFEEAKACFYLAAEQRHAEATNLLGEMYFNGHGMEQNIETGADLISMAADLGSFTARANMGWIMWNAENQAMGKELLLKAAKKNNPTGLCLLGKMYLNEHPVDCKKAVKYLTDAANLGNEGAMVTLGGLYWNGTCVNRDRKTAAMWYNKAEQYNNPGNYWAIGTYYDAAYQVEKAMDYYRRAASIGDVRGMTRMMNIYKGKNDQAYFHWTRRAAAAGDAGACFTLAENYRVGRPAPFFTKNADSAAFFYRKSLENGHPSAYNMLATMSSYGDDAASYELGVYKEEDGKQDDAVYWYRLAVEQGNHKQAIAALRRLGVPSKK